MIDHDLTAEIVDLYDAALYVPGVLVTLFEADAPGAESCARQFAEVHGLRVEHDKDTNVIRVRRGREAVVTVHLKEAP